MIPHLRVARPSRDLAAVARFYVEGLGFEVLATFENHEGFDGVIMGYPDAPYHLEFTRRRHDPVAPTPTEEDLLVFYLPDQAGWAAAVRRLHATGARSIPSSNPYWDTVGITFEDPDGNRVVLQNARWAPAPP